MKKLTNEQIEKIDVALAKIGIAYADIRIELTDHIASELENKDGDFDRNLKTYILDNRKAIRKLNFKFMAMASRKAYRVLAGHLFGWRSLVLATTIIISGYFLDKIIEREYLSMILFYGYAIASCANSFPQAIRAFKKKPSYSTASGFSIINLLSFYPAIFMMSWQREMENALPMIAFYAAIITITLAMYRANRKLSEQIRLRYNG